MGNAAVKIRIMPDSPNSDLKIMGEKAKKIIEKNHGKIYSSELELIAFGLKAIIITFSIKEEFEQDPLLYELRNIKNVSSAEIIDFRRIGF
ncbi:MAG: hypothetical protein QW727_03630 [Candidatus Pacearchaeota archaeon]